MNKFFPNLLLIWVTAGQDISFTADINIKDPYVQGSLNGVMHYYYNRSIGSTNHMSRIDYSPPINVQEILLDGKDTKYKFCGTTCSSELWKDPIEQLYLITATDTATGVIDPITNCAEYLRSPPPIESNMVKTIWVRSTDTSIVCRATISTAIGDKVYTFTNYVNTPLDLTVFDDWTDWKCPGPICNQIMDIVLILDMSGTIGKDDWVQIVNWVKSIINAFTISMKSTTMGIVAFSSEQKTGIISPLSADSQHLSNAITNYVVQTGFTGISFGLLTGMSVLNATIPPRELIYPTKMMVTLSDGRNNNGIKSRELFNSVTASIHEQNILSFAVGVGALIDMDSLLKISTTLPGFTTVFTATSFSELPNIVNDLVFMTCDQLNPMPCGIDCAGFCGCNLTCMCPSCDTTDQCYDSVCTDPSLGCLSIPKSCSDGNECTIDTCDPMDGCHHVNRTCDDGQSCTLNLCNPSIGGGCYYLPDSCDDHDPCTLDTCGQNGCVNTYQCDSHDACHTGICDPINGCLFPVVVCDDHNGCTDNQCDQILGCQYPATDCEDRNVCTDDSCTNQTGCLHRDHVCNDGDPCTADLCNPLLGGCYYPPIDCDACLADPKTCQEVCQSGFCQSNPVNHSLSMCNYTVQLCDSGNRCLLNTCSPSGECSNTPITCYQSDKCSIHLCNATTGLCDAIPKDCSSTDPCFVGYCDPLTGLCRRRSFCEVIPCTTSACQVVGQTPFCNRTTMTCDTGTQCMIGYCDPMTGCVYVERECDDQINCTIDSCDPIKGCQHTINLCDDSNPCTDDYCNETTGCLHTPKCNDGLGCTVDSCLRDGTCMFVPLVCHLDTSEDTCFTNVCTETRGCIRKTLDSAFVDVCGNCIKTYGEDPYVWNSSNVMTVCVAAMTWPTFAATMTAAAAVGIILAALLAALIVALSSIFGTREIIRRAKEAQDQAAHNNPLYQDSGRELTNPTYQDNI